MIKNIQSQIEFAYVLVYKDDEQGLQATLFKKKTDRQPYLHAKSDHPMPLKKSILYNQMLSAKRICSTNSEFEHNCKVLQEQFTKRCYDSSSIETEIKKIKRRQERIANTNNNTERLGVASDGDI